MATIIKITSIEQARKLHEAGNKFYTTTYTGFWWNLQEVETEVTIVDNGKGELMYRFSTSWPYWHPIERKKHSDYFYIDGQVLYTKAL